MRSKPNSASLKSRHQLIFAALLAASSLLAQADAVDDAKDLLLASDYAGAYQTLQAPAARGDAEAQYQLATLYRMGLGVGIDNAQAWQWYQRAAAQNHTAAQYQLATMYEKGLGTTVDNAQATAWLHRAAANGSTQAQQKLAALSQHSTSLSQQPTALTNDGGEQLLHAARKGDSAQITALLTRGVAIDSIDSEGNTPLMLAAAAGNADIVELLLSKNAAVNLKNRSGDSALLLSANKNDGAVNAENVSKIQRDVRIVTTLLQHGADINAVDSNRNNALLLAAGRGNIAICKQLLAQPNAAKTLNIKNLAGDSALDLARRADNTALLQTLAAAGVKSASPTHSILDKKSADSAQLAAFTQGDARYANWPALNIAAWRGDAALVDTLIKRGDAIDTPDPENFTPLMRAVYQGDHKIATRLLQAGADSNRVGAEKKTALWFAIERNDSAMIELLLQRGALPNKAPARADSIAFAAKNSDEKIVLALLKSATDVETAYMNVTPLMSCAQRGFAQATQQLLARHAQIDRRDSAGRSALWLAAANNRVDIVELLLHPAAPSHNGAAPDLADREEVTALAIAATRGHSTVVDTLIRNGAAIDKATREGNTPLLLAARNARVDIIKRLLAAKTDVEHRNERSETALMLAAASGSSASVAALLDAGVDAKRRDKNGRTAVDYARLHKFDDLAQRLQDHIDKKQKFSP